ncbi:reactive intermediate/imine deaminase [Deltaproteobacteria bacterium]|nr:reactive intermediate/imine deaminase [Deltaproteobacteria bacterium]
MKTIATSRAPAAIGPYSQAIVHGGVVYCSGQIALDPASGLVVGADVAAQTRQVLKNLDAVLVAAESSRARVIRTTVFLRDMADFNAMNGVYAEFFGETRPARATVAVAGLPRDVKVEIDCVAAVSEGTVTSDASWSNPS